jgi:hypothetical protein
MRQRSVAKVIRGKLRKADLFSPAPAIHFVTASRKGFLTQGDAVAFCKALRTGSSAWGQP